MVFLERLIINLKTMWFWDVLPGRNNPVEGWNSKTPGLRLPTETQETQNNLSILSQETGYPVNIDTEIPKLTIGNRIMRFYKGYWTKYMIDQDNTGYDITNIWDEYRVIEGEFLARGWWNNYTQIHLESLRKVYLDDSWLLHPGIQENRGDITGKMTESEYRTVYWETRDGIPLSVLDKLSSIWIADKLYEVLSCSLDVSNIDRAHIYISTGWNGFRFRWHSDSQDTYTPFESVNWPEYIVYSATGARTKLTRRTDGVYIASPDDIPYLFGADLESDARKVGLIWGGVATKSPTDDNQASEVTPLSSKIWSKVPVPRRKPEDLFPVLTLPQIKPVIHAWDTPKKDSNNITPSLEPTVIKGEETIISLPRKRPSPDKTPMPRLREGDSIPTEEQVWYQDKTGIPLVKKWVLWIIPNEDVLTSYLHGIDFLKKIPQLVWYNWLRFEKDSQGFEKLVGDKKYYRVTWIKGEIWESWELTEFYIALDGAVLNDTSVKTKEVIKDKDTKQNISIYAKSYKKVAKMRHEGLMRLLKGLPTKNIYLKKRDTTPESHIEWIMALQFTLAGIYPNSNININGVFDDITDGLVRKFQLAEWLTVDWIVGSKTIEEIEKTLS